MKQSSSLRGAVLWVLFVLLLTGSAQARSAGARLEYARSDRAAACPDQEALKAAVAKRLGYDPFLPAAHQTIVVEITNADPGLRGQISLVDDQGIIRGSRELSERAEHCDELVASLALAISIALDPSVAPEPAEPTTPGEPEEKPVPAPQAEPVIPAPAASAKPRSLAGPAPVKPTTASVTAPELQRGPFSVRASGFGILGAAPAPSGGFRVGGSLTWPWFRLTAELNDRFKASSRVEHVGAVSTSLLALTLAPCVAKQEVALCALLGIGSLRVSSHEILDPATERLLDVSLGARLEFTPTLVGRLKLLTDLDIGRSLRTTILTIHGQNIWQTPAASGAFGLGLAWQF